MGSACKLQEVAMKYFNLLALLFLLTGCKGGGSGGGWPSVLSEQIIVNLDARPALGIRELVLETTRVEARRALYGNWIEISQSGSPRPPLGAYDALRIQIGSGSRVATADGSYAGPLALPPDLANGLTVPVDFTVSSGQWTSINLLFDTLQSLQAQPAGSASPYLFRPTFRVFNGFGGNQNGLVWKRSATTPLPLAMVTAQVPRAPDPPEILEWGLTSPAQTQWSLMYLPLGQPVCLVATHTGQDVCVPKASIKTLNQVINTMIEFTRATVPLAGSVQGRVTPVPGPDQADLILVLQDLEVAPGRSEQLIVARVLPILAAEETFTVPSLAPGSYQLCVLRRSFGASGAESSRSHAWSPSCLVVAGQSTSMDLAF